MREYYDRRAVEFDDVYLGKGQFDDVVWEGFTEELRGVEAMIAGLPPGSALDVACGTGFLTRHLQGSVVALDQSEAMLAIAGPRLPRATLVRGDALRLPFPDKSFDRVFTANFYGHLEEEERLMFLGEARRVAPELVVVDAPLREGVAPVEMQERVLGDGSRWRILKRYFTPDELLGELGGGDVLFAGSWFLAVRSKDSALPTVEQTRNWSGARLPR